MDTETLEPGTVLELPEPETAGSVSVEAALASRRSRRNLATEPLDLETVGQLLWAAQGQNDPDSGFRTAPSAGATFPLELTLTVGDGGVPDLSAGVYHYDGADHALEVRSTGDVQPSLRDAALDQAWIESAPVTVVMAAVDERTEAQYAERGRERYVPMEAGHAGQNLYLQAEVLGLGTVAVGAFEDDAVSDVLDLPGDQRPLYIFPVGKRPPEE